MKILFIADNVPGLHSGSAVRNYYLLKALSSKNKIDLLCLTDDMNDVPIEMYQKLPNVTFYILERKMKNIMQKMNNIIQGEIPYMQQRVELLLPKDIVKKLKDYHVIHLAELNSYFIIEKYLPLPSLIILDAHNVEAINTMSAIKKKPFPYNAVSHFFLHKLKQTEINIVRTVDYLLVCSAIDKEYFENYISSKKIEIIPNGVNRSYFNLYTPDKKKMQNKTSVLFMGLQSYYPNQEGLTYYLTTIHETIKKIIPNYELLIIGKGKHALAEQMSKTDSTIKILGFVEDTRTYIADAEICIAPLLSGSGTRLKILEYMAMKMAVVSTSKGSEGITVTNNKNIIVADTASKFIEAISILHTDEVLRANIGKNAYALIKEKYDWESIGERLNALYNDWTTV